MVSMLWIYSLHLELVVVIISGTHHSVICHLYQGLHGKASLRIRRRSTSHPGDAGDPPQYR